jgi:hypothetical protein
MGLVTTWSVGVDLETITVLLQSISSFGCESCAKAGELRLAAVKNSARTPNALQGLRKEITRTSGESYADTNPDAS